MTIDTILERNPVVPVVTITDGQDAVALAGALAEGGIRILEIALRSAPALDAISAIRHALPEMTVGAGTVKSAADLAGAVAAGAQFVVSPGTTATLAEAIAASNIPFLPAAATASEIMTLLDRGFRAIKFFPASAMGGIAALAALAGPFPEARFCPSGGVGAGNYLEYLALDNVLCVSGSWLTPSTAIEKKRWRDITRQARVTVDSLA